MRGPHGASNGGMANQRRESMEKTKKDGELTTGGAVVLVGCLVLIAMVCGTVLGIAWIVWG